jgi:pyruvate/2-oxoacid:ferredoxin oxidoreductase beta subunit
MAVESRVFPLLEVEDGVRWTVQQAQQEISVRDYIRLQGRFGHLEEADMEAMEKSVREEWELLLAKASRVFEL